MRKNHLRTSSIKGGYDKSLYQTPIYKSWVNMKTRCLNPNIPYFERYGGRGISICDRWLNFNNFFSDMVPTHKDGLTLDRIDNNGNYCKENCRWADRTIQANNRRSNRFVTFRGETKTVNQWAKLSGLKRSTFSMRFYHRKWPIKRCLEGGLYAR